MKNRSKCVGVIIRNNAGEYLCQYRLKHPIGLALIAGHVDKGETPAHGAIRETKEETGIKIVKFSLMLHGVFKNSCSRGHKFHEWFVYLVSNWRGKPKLFEKEKHAFVLFLSLKEINKWIMMGEFDPVWFEEILPKLEII